MPRALFAEYLFAPVFFIGQTVLQLLSFTCVAPLYVRINMEHAKKPKRRLWLKPVHEKIINPRLKPWVNNENRKGFSQSWPAIKDN